MCKQNLDQSQSLIFNNSTGTPNLMRPDLRTPDLRSPNLSHENSHSLSLAYQWNNDETAQANRLWLFRHKITAFNIMSSPGSGKTALLEKTLTALKDQYRLAVLVGDQFTNNDAERMAKTGVPVRQINTVSLCHLDAKMISRELDNFVHDLEPQILFIENIGNLVCPAAFDLGETSKIALMATTEGEDKPQKYPLVFRDAAVIIVSKMDLAPHLDWSFEKAIENIRRINSRAPILPLSVKSGEGMGDWLGWLERNSLV